MSLSQRIPTKVELKKYSARLCKQPASTLRQQKEINQAQTLALDFRTVKK